MRLSPSQYLNSPCNRDENPRLLSGSCYIAAVDIFQEDIRNSRVITYVDATRSMSLDTVYVWTRGGFLEWTRPAQIRLHPHVFMKLGSIEGMSITPKDLAKYIQEDDDDVPLGAALRDLSVDVETDAVADVRDLRERT